MHIFNYKARMPSDKVLQPKKRAILESFPIPSPIGRSTKKTVNEMVNSDKLRYIQEKLLNVTFGT